jgi:drug/metabolite transporter (DMT)-like permease
VLIQPVAAAILGYLVFGESLTPLQTLGGAAALIGVVIAQRGQPGVARPIQPAPAQ